MHSWTTIMVLVVVFAFAIEFRPLDHFMTTYLTSPRVNITVSQVNTNSLKLCSIHLLIIEFKNINAFIIFLL